MAMRFESVAPQTFFARSRGVSEPSASDPIDLLSHARSSPYTASTYFAQSVRSGSENVHPRCRSSLPRLLSLLDHHLPQSPVDPCLVAPPTPLEPRQHIGVQPQRHRLLHRLIHAGPLLRQVPRTPPGPRRRLNFRHFSRRPG